MIGLNSVIAHQQPARQAFRKFMYPVARSGLSGLDKQRLDAAQKAFAQLG